MNGDEESIVKNNTNPKTKAMISITIEYLTYFLLKS